MTPSVPRHAVARIESSASPRSRAAEVAPLHGGFGGGAGARAPKRRTPRLVSPDAVTYSHCRRSFPLSQIGESLIDSPSTAVSPAAPPDDLDREVYCVLGLPIDAVGMAEVLRGIDAAAAGSSPFLLSTPNLNFLVTEPERRAISGIAAAQRSLPGRRHADRLDRPAHRRCRSGSGSPGPIFSRRSSPVLRRC